MSDRGDVIVVAVLSHFGRMNSFGLMMILEISPNPALLIMEYSSSWVIFPNALGIHNAGYSYDDNDNDNDNDDRGDDVSVCICMIFVFGVVVV